MAFTSHRQEGDRTARRLERLSRAATDGDSPTPGEAIQPNTDSPVASPAAVRGNFPTGRGTSSGFAGSDMPQSPDIPPAKRGRPPQDTAERLAAAHARVAAAADDAELHLAHAALRRAQRAHAATLGFSPKYRLGRPPTGKSRRKGKSGKGGKMPHLEGAALDERTRLLELALAKCHADRKAPVAGTSWAELARTLSVHPSDLRAGRRSPALDRRLREYIGEAM